MIETEIDDGAEDEPSDIVAPIVPAQAGYFVVDLCPQKKHLRSLPVVAWALLDNTWPLPIYLGGPSAHTDPADDTFGILCPDGQVIRDEAAWPSLDAFREHRMAEVRAKDERPSGESAH